MDITWDMFIETEVPKDELIISRTDLKGVITYANETFAKISGYTPEELIGKPHNILRHPDMPKSVFQELWQTIRQEKIWKGYVKNLRKDKGFYWVYAEVSGVYKNGKLVEYKSMRSWVPKEKRIEMQKRYDQMRLDAGEHVRCVSYIDSATYKKLLEKAQELGETPETLIKNLIYA
ncbi:MULTISPECIES: PAS domain-containing protein [unclassified Nitratiruptor]|uniref:PAS domain-containing protein n=1 Tax=unclassified Nitratiruptor TaxID=2624044 RepID=UPI0019155A04|nr:MULTISPECIES: PAS domain-containing protein [unclassified Nitratiruptor]BCD61080.1 aerotaxis receptor [Nitratiruptor sp. YY08-10]BCD65013.1 aerotaxis receptor [Nitratiruptor sp. YY08-14]